MYMCIYIYTLYRRRQRLSYWRTWRASHTQVGGSTRLHPNCSPQSQAAWGCSETHNSGPPELAGFECHRLAWIFEEVCLPDGFLLCGHGYTHSIVSYVNVTLHAMTYVQQRLTHIIANAVLQRGHEPALLDTLAGVKSFTSKNSRLTIWLFNASEWIRMKIPNISKWKPNKLSGDIRMHGVFLMWLWSISSYWPLRQRHCASTKRDRTRLITSPRNAQLGCWKTRSCCKPV